MPPSPAAPPRPLSPPPPTPPTVGLDLKLKPEPPPPSSGGPGAPVFKSSIRTMQEDIASLQKGQAPAGFQIKKESEPTKPAPPPEPTGPRITLPPKPAPQVELGKPQRAAPLPGGVFSTPPTIHPPTPSAPLAPEAGFQVPKGGGMFKRRAFLFVVLGIVIVAVVIYMVALRGPSTPEVVISPTPSRSVSPSPSPALPTLETIFGTSKRLIVPVQGDTLAQIRSTVTAATLNLGEMAVYKVVDDANGPYNFDKFLAKLGIKPPSTDTVLKTNDWLVGVYAQAKGSSTTEVEKKLFIVATISDVDKLSSIVAAWTPTLVKDLGQLMGYDKNTKNQLADDTYNSINFRYVKVPDNHSGLAYASIEKYMIFASSKDSFRSVVDLLLSKLTP